MQKKIKGKKLKVKALKKQALVLASLSIETVRNTMPTTQWTGHGVSPFSGLEEAHVSQVYQRAGIYEKTNSR